jgi:L,D-peptidoglycan transpeptidase YkuD (ErfK/YbiS/YcfS/YnhG family)
LALRGVGPKCEAESHGRRVTKVGREVKPEKAAAGGLGAAEQRVREAHLGAAGPATFTRVGDQKPPAAILARDSRCESARGLRE